MNIKIKPKHIELTEVLITSVSVSLEKTAYITGLISGIELSQTFTIQLTQEEYNAWGDNDDYLINLVLTKLGLEKA